MTLTKEQIKQLKDKKFRRVNGLFLVEGEKFCHDLLNNDIDIEHTISTNGNYTDFPNLVLVSDKVLKSLATTITNQDIICVCKCHNYPINSVGNSLILDNLQDPGNVGTLIRSAVAFNFKDIYLIGGADAYSEKVIRASAGEILFSRVHMITYEELSEHKAEIADVFMVADMLGEPINKIHLPNKRISVIIGNEGNGVSPYLRRICDKTISIPMTPGVESLNAGVAGSIIMQKIYEKRG